MYKCEAGSCNPSPEGKLTKQQCFMSCKGDKDLPYICGGGCNAGPSTTSLKDLNNICRKIHHKCKLWTLPKSVGQKWPHCLNDYGCFPFWRKPYCECPEDITWCDKVPKNQVEDILRNGCQR